MKNLYDSSSKSIMNLTVPFFPLVSKTSPKSKHFLFLVQFNNNKTQHKNTYIHIMKKKNCICCIMVYNIIRIDQVVLYLRKIFGNVFLSHLPLFFPFFYIYLSRKMAIIYGIFHVLLKITPLGLGFILRFTRYIFLCTCPIRDGYIFLCIQFCFFLYIDTTPLFNVLLTFIAGGNNNFQSILYHFSA